MFTSLGIKGDDSFCKEGWNFDDISNSGCYSNREIQKISPQDAVKECAKLETGSYLPSTSENRNLDVDFLIREYSIKDDILTFSGPSCMSIYFTIIIITCSTFEYLYFLIIDVHIALAHSDWDFCWTNKSGIQSCKL